MQPDEAMAPVAAPAPDPNEPPFAALVYTYDGFGNLTGKTPTQGYAPAMTGSADSNATGGALSGQWDVEKRPMTQAATQGPAYYVYDPWGRRIWKQWYNTTYGTTNCEAYFYGATGQKLESYSCVYSSGSLGATLEGINTYFAGKMLSEKGVFIATDRLGSVRGDSNGVTMSYYPWGEERGQGRRMGERSSRDISGTCQGRIMRWRGITARRAAASGARIPPRESLVPPNR
jgi:hypothetical protein